MTNSVVKFMVMVRLMENRVNSHVGRVIVAKVMSQYRTPGMMLKRKSIHCPSAANIEAVPSRLCAENGRACVESAAVAEERADVRVREDMSKSAARVGKASDASMSKDRP